MEAIFLLIGQNALWVILLLMFICLVVLAYLIGLNKGISTFKKETEEYIEKIENFKTVTARGWIIEETNAIKAGYALQKALMFISKNEDILDFEEFLKIYFDIISFYKKEDERCKKDLDRVQKHFYPCIDCKYRDLDKNSAKCFYCQKNDYKSFEKKYTNFEENYTTEEKKGN